MKTLTYHVSGTHCASCKIRIEGALRQDPDIIKVHVDIKKETIQIETTIEKNTKEFALRLSEKIKPYGYTLSVEKINVEKKQDDIIWKAIPLGLLFLILFFLLQKSGILNIGLGGKTNPATSFLVGLIASVSSCLAVVGGLVLSLSTQIVQNKKASAQKTFFLFHVGRILGFALFGGALGVLGKSLGVNLFFSGLLGIIASLIMLALGLNLVGIFKKNTFTLPARLFSLFIKFEKENPAPFLVGAGTFFLPCGFTQSMQVAALSGGSFLSGMFLMFAFALGTLPILALLSFGSISFAHSKHAPLFFKSAGIVIIGLGSFSLISGLIGMGFINPLFTL
jgi:sulfite exporter TauE/SafE/copper chaperone CopZ